jgi:UDP-N-acetylglucosamine acyltransferase
VVITGRTTIGESNRIFQFASIGEEPQDKKYGGEDTELIIGDNNTIREACTFSRGTVQGFGKTIIGSNNWIMACVHIAHDCILGDNIIMANNASLAGHVTVGDWAILSGYSLIRNSARLALTAHFICQLRQSEHSPYVTVSGEKAKARGINAEGLRRRGYTSEQIQQIKRVQNAVLRQQNPGGSQEELVKMYAGSRKFSPGRFSGYHRKEHEVLPRQKPIA